MGPTAIANRRSQITNDQSTINHQQSTIPEGLRPCRHRARTLRLVGAERLVQADVMTNQTAGTTFIVPLRLDLPMPDQHTLSMTEMSAAGTIRAFFYHPLKKIVQGMLLSDETQIRLPPDASQELRRSFHIGDRLTVRGNGTINRFGRAVEALAIGRNSGALVPLDASLQTLPR